MMTSSSSSSSGWTHQLRPLLFVLSIFHFSCPSFLLHLLPSLLHLFPLPSILPSVFPFSLSLNLSHPSQLPLLPPHLSSPPYLSSLLAVVWWRRCDVVWCRFPLLSHVAWVDSWRVADFVQLSVFDATLPLSPRLPPLTYFSTKTIWILFLSPLLLSACVSFFISEKEKGRARESESTPIQ